VDLKLRWGDDGQNDESNKRTWVLIGQVGELALGLIADDVTRIIRIGSNSILPAPAITLSGLASPYIRGLCESEMGMLVVLDFNRLFTADELEALKKI
jgi:chemotaxis signal transduction protein